MNAQLEERDQLPSAVPGLNTRAAGAETLVHDQATGRVHVLNAIAARVLARCDGVALVGTIVDEIVDATGADRGRVIRDVNAVLVDFRAKGLLS